MSKTRTHDMDLTLEALTFLWLPPSAPGLLHLVPGFDNKTTYTRSALFLKSQQGEKKIDPLSHKA